MYPALHIAEYVVAYCCNHGKSISNLKLQKILYFLQAEFLAVKNMPCFREKIMAWDFGPVVPDVYYHYKIYGGASIPPSNNIAEPFSKSDKTIADGIIGRCMSYSAAELTEMTQKQTPWRNAYCHNKLITNDSLKTFFETPAVKNRKANKS